MFFLHTMVGPGQIAIDVGANVGIYTGWLSRLVGPSGRVLALEPYPPIFERLVKNVRRMRATNVITLNEAVGADTGWTSLELPMSRRGEVNDPYIHVQTGSGLGGQVRLTTIDEIVHREGFQQVNLIKVDVEGYERYAIEGSRETIQNFRPLILIEIYDRWARRYGSSFHEVDELLAGLGYSGYLLHDGRLFRARDPPNMSRNYFYVPNARR